MARVAALWRHPVKSHGRESLKSVTLAAGQTMPWDRRWAVAHEAARTDGRAWAPCANFSRGAKAAALMAISARSDTAAGTVTLSHPDRPDLTFDPDREEAAFLDWVRPLMPENRAQSARMMRVEGRGMTDTEFPSLSLVNLASGEDLGRRMGQALSPLRWRANIHLEGLEPWAERGWIGRRLRAGEAELVVREHIGRCLATAANPETGARDADTLGALAAEFGHTEFGIYAEVTRTGTLAVGDPVEPLE
ncbi:MAG: MOSC domain-containing protein [Roseovarius sp.]|nr:MOSC domain-containing protein [Roseovarius sp.]